MTHERPDERGGAREESPGLLDRAGDIFLAVRELGVVARDEEIERRCGDDAALKRMVALLLRGDGAPLPIEALADDIRAASDGMASTHGRAGVASSDRIGNYRILERLGEGGFGVVYLAEQERPVRRRVALKIIKLGMDTRQVVARFEAERQALAMMEHPNIAKVLDAGATETGRPYFVMELVRGLPLTEYCDRNELTIRQRLAVIAEVCDALQHAHQKGVIHRDIKPSNVLVRAGDGEGPASRGAEAVRVKVIDFGVAKATSARLTEKTIFTEFRQMIGTPEYMSPEQAGEAQDDVDTRTDVYSCGVLLYELLTGSTPLDSARLRSAAYGEMQRMIREEQPLKPSTRLSTRLDTLGAVASRRGARPEKLPGMLRGELDWIVMKALEKDRARRYESAGDMAADIRRYLEGREVLAAPPSMAYRLRAFVRRHRGAVLLASLTSAALLAGLVGTSVGFYNATLERREAEKRADELELVAAFQAEVLGQLDPRAAGAALSGDVLARLERALDRDGAAPAERDAQLEAFRAGWRRVNPTDTAREFIDRTLMRPSARAIDERFGAQPLVAARLREALAQRYQALGLFDAAIDLQEKVVHTREREQGESHRSTIASLVNLGTLLHQQGRNVEAEHHTRRALVLAERALGERHAFTLSARHALGCIVLQVGRADEAEGIFRELLGRMGASMGEDHPDTLNAMINYAGALRAQDRLLEAEPVLLEAIERMRRVLGPDHPRTLQQLHNLGTIRQQQERWEDAERCFREVLEKKRAALGETHPSTLASVQSLAVTLGRRGRHDEAIALLVGIEPAVRSAAGESAGAPLGSLLLALGCSRSAVATTPAEFAAAESELREARAIFTSENGAHPGNARAADEALEALTRARNRSSE